VLPLAIDVTSGDFILSVVALVLGLVGAPLIVIKMQGGFDDRGSEDAARDFYAEHGHWPDETPEEAEAARAAARALGHGGDVVADDDGRL
jgi:hypothetical protein